MQILVIDDDPDSAELLSAFLTQNGHSVTTASRAAQGRRLFKEERPDAVFLDIVLPDGNGIELLREMVRLDPGVPVVMMTGFRDAEYVVSAFRAGALDCLIKPFNFEYIRGDLLPKIPLRKPGSSD